MRHELSILNPGQEPRRRFLWRLGGGLGGIAVADLLGRHGLLAGETPVSSRAALNGGLHHRPKQSASCSCS